MNKHIPPTTIENRLRLFYGQRGQPVTDEQIQQDLEIINFEMTVAAATGNDVLDALDEWFARTNENLAYVEKLYGSP